MAGGTILRCPQCRPIGTKVTTIDGRHLGFVPEALYVGYLMARPRSAYKKPPSTCPNCGTLLRDAAVPQGDDMAKGQLPPRSVHDA